MTLPKGKPEAPPETFLVLVPSSQPAPLESAPHRRSRARQAAFLAAFRQTASLARAAAAAKIGRRRHYHWIGEDPAYGRAFAAVQRDIFCELYPEARRRAIRRFSDRALVLLLEICNPQAAKMAGARPEVIREYRMPRKWPA